MQPIVTYWVVWSVRRWCTFLSLFLALKYWFLFWSLRWSPWKRPVMWCFFVQICMDIVATFPAGTGGKSVITCLQYLFDMACDTVDLLALRLSNVSPCFVIDSQLLVLLLGTPVLVLVCELKSYVLWLRSLLMSLVYVCLQATEQHSHDEELWTTRVITDSQWRPVWHGCWHWLHIRMCFPDADTLVALPADCTENFTAWTDEWFCELCQCGCSHI